MTEKNIWMIRAGENGRLIKEFIDNNIVAIGWNKIGNLTQYKSLEDIKNAMLKDSPEKKEQSISMQSGQLYHFLYDLQKDDYVISYNPLDRIYHIGIIEDEYEYKKDICEYHNIRKTKWIKEISRDDLSTSTKNALGAWQAIFILRDKTEILSLIEGKEVESEAEEDSKEILESIREDWSEKAHEFIKDKISKLDWEDMQELFAGILRAMGYKTIVSDKGPDKGKDILASPDGLGLEEPRIKVEVKHRKGSIGAPEIRSFMGTLRKGYGGLYVSIGGFTNEAKYEAERSDRPITLIDLDMLVDLIIQHYDNFDIEAKELIPLKKLYWPI